MTPVHTPKQVSAATRKKFCQHTGWCEVNGDGTIDCWSCGRIAPERTRNLWRLFNTVALVLGMLVATTAGILVSRAIVRLFS